MNKQSSLQKLKLHYEYAIPLWVVRKSLQNIARQKQKGVIMTPDTSSTRLKTRNKKQKETKVKNFFKKAQTIVVITIIVTLAVVYGAYRLYAFVYDKGYADAVNERAEIARQVAELSKQNQ